MFWRARREGRISLEKGTILEEEEKTLHYCSILNVYNTKYEINSFHF